MAVLEKLKSYSDLKQLNNKELVALSDDIRDEIIDVVKNNGGHLSANLGIVETTVALHRVFDFPKDKLLFDVGHQCYAHKLLSERKERFCTIRTHNGISGFPDPDESEFDAFIAGHAGNSIAAAVGLCQARDKVGDDYCVIDVVGDGAAVNGLSLEALTATETKPKNLVVILNDNGMSISKNRNGLYRFISRHTTGAGYVKGKNAAKRVLGGSFVGKAARKVRNFVKTTLNRGMPFEQFGFKYIGIVNGNDIKELNKILERVKLIAKNKAVFLHIKTTKGKGLTAAEERSDLYHGVGRDFSCSCNGFGTALGEKLNALIDADKRVVAVCAGMKDGTGLSCVAERHGGNFYDVGIAEEFAATFAAGMAKGGLKPVVAIYSTFLQRAYDEILHDVCMQNLPVVFCLDRAGLVGEDGKTHQGVFDLSYLLHMPNMTVLAPSDESELSLALDYALSLGTPVAIRYPKKSGTDADALHSPFTVSLWQRVKDGDDVTVLAVGPRMNAVAKEFAARSAKSVGVINARSVKPLDEGILEEIKNTEVVTLEENSVIGGFGAAVACRYAQTGASTRVYVCGIKDEFVKTGNVEEQLIDCGLTADDLLRRFG